MTDKTDGVLAVLDRLIDCVYGTPVCSDAVSARNAVAELLAAAERSLANLDIINPQGGPHWSGLNDQEDLRSAILAMRGDE